MFATIKQIVVDNYTWRHQIWDLALVDIKKTYRGAVLGWAWMFAKPLIYIGCFWFALDLGLRASDTVGDYPFILWLATGLIPWFFMADMLTAGSGVLKRYSYLVNRIRFPLSAISSFFALSSLMVFAVCFVVMLAVALACGIRFDAHLAQVPLVVLVMYLFFVLWSIMTSPLTAISKDLGNLIKAMSLPLFWVSGVIFNVSAVEHGWVSTVLSFNPVTFFVTAMRAAVCDRYWVWEKPELLLPFAAVLTVTALCALLAHRQFSKGVADEL
ncbi:MAG: ABC transporter permease [Coriobacteriales bacterium]|nr:ABC transporter permease [Coriobacteriales bacterium]